MHPTDNAGPSDSTANSELQRRWPWSGAIQARAGVAIPLFSLRSATSVGVGEFDDIRLLVDWCLQTGLALIQFLPLNDTGDDPSPYSATSSIALNPVYCSLQSVDGAAFIEKRLSTLRNKFEKQSSFSYIAVRTAKMAMLGHIFRRTKSNLKTCAEFQTWIQNNAWSRDYAVFCILKQQFDRRWWREWPDEDVRRGSERVIDSVAAAHPDKCLFYQWVQWHCDTQLRKAHAYAQKCGVALKGDIPILMNDDSVDVWQHPEFFETRLRAGAPPDMFTDKGQNWGFPLYRWDKLEADDFGWWRRRLQMAQQYYDALRIDHVLGFFRLWSIPASEKTARCGYFEPSVPITQAQLEKLGLKGELIDRLAVPAIRRSAVMNACGVLGKSVLRRFFAKTGTHAVYRFKETISSEKDIEKRTQKSPQLTDVIWKFWADRLLLRDVMRKKRFQFRWDHRQTTAWTMLDNSLQRKISRFLTRYEQRQNAFWEKRGRVLLNMILTSTHMLICAEDLGYVPPIVRPLLEEFNIFSLKVHRWEKNYHRKPSTFIDPRTFHRLSVNTLSTHDSTTFRGWWEESATETKEYAESIRLEAPPAWLTVEAAEKSIAACLSALSLLTILAMQDWCSLSLEPRTYHPQEERINVPGTIADTNWSWRMKMPLEQLMTMSPLTETIHRLLTDSNRLMRGHEDTKKNR